MRTRRSLVVLMTLLLTVWLGGCGKKGHLYLPDKPRPTAQANDRSAPAPAQAPEDDRPSLPPAPASP